MTIKVVWGLEWNTASLVKSMSLVNIFCPGTVEMPKHGQVSPKLWKSRGYSGAHQRKHIKFRVTGFCAVNSRHRWPVTRKMFPFDYVITTLPSIENLLTCKPCDEFQDQLLDIQEMTCYMTAPSLNHCWHYINRFHNFLHVKNIFWL